MKETKYIFCINFLIFLYLALPIYLFIYFWTNIYISIPFIVLTTISLLNIFKTNIFNISNIFISKCDIYKFLICIILLIVWVYLSGIGKFVWQNYDHNVRNTIFDILVSYDWPVIKSLYFNNNLKNVSLVYYIAFWLPSALIGKLFGITAGYIFQFLWAIYGIIIFYYLMSIYLKRIYIHIVLLFIFFSGWDIIGVACLGLLNDINIASHIENWSTFQYSSNTTLLFWVYNQAIPAWIFTVSILNITNLKFIFFVYSFAFIYAPFPFVGLLPFVLLRIIDKFICNKFTIKETIAECISFENFIGIFCIIPLIYLYFSSNYAAEIMHIFDLQYMDLKFYILFILFEVIIYFVFIYKTYGFDICLFFSLIVLIICPFIRIGNSIDFCMRTSIPSLLVLFLYIAKSSIYCLEFSKIKYLSVLCCLVLIGSFTPFSEVYRTLNITTSRIIHDKVVCNKQVTEDDVFHGLNFIGNIYKNDIGGVIFRKNYIDNITVNKKSDCKTSKNNTKNMP